METPRCPECGVVLPEALESCPHCGAMLPTPGGGNWVPVRPPQTPPPPPPVAETPDVAALVQSASTTPPVRVTRKFTAHVSINLPQAAVDKRGLLTPDQWTQLLQVWDEAVEARVKSGLERGQISAVSSVGEVAVPWERVDAQLTPEQQQEIDAGLHELLAATRKRTTVTPHFSASVEVTPGDTRRASAGCGVLAVALLLVPAVSLTMLLR
jgi:hypothetical protein